MRRLAALLVLAAGCGGPPPLPPPVGSTEVIFSLDLDMPLPLLTIKTRTPEETARLKSTYKTFRVEMGPPVNGITLSLAPQRGVLELPWGVYLRNFKAPYPVRLIGFKPDGTREVIREEHLK